MSEEENVIERQGLVFLEHGLDVCESGRAECVPTNAQLDIFFSRLARLKDVEPGVWVCGRFLLLPQAVANFLSCIGRKGGISGLLILVWIGSRPQWFFISRTELLHGTMELLEYFSNTEGCTSLNKLPQHLSVA